MQRFMHLPAALRASRAACLGLAFIVAISSTYAQSPATTATQSSPRPASVETYAALPRAQQARLSPDGKRLAYIGDVRGRHALIVSSVHDGDKPAVLTLGESLESWSAFAVDGPGKITPLGTVARPAWGLNLSADLTRAAVVQLDYRADAWLNKVEVR